MAAKSTNLMLKNGKWKFKTVLNGHLFKLIDLRWLLDYKRNIYCQISLLACFKSELVHLMQCKMTANIHFSQFLVF